MPAESPLPKLWLLRSLDIETDAHAGPSQQVRLALGALLQAAQELTAENVATGEAARLLTAYMERLRRAVPDLHLLPHWLARASTRVEAGSAAVVEDTATALTELDRIQAQLVRAGESLFPPGQRMLTLGHSHVVRALLQAYGDRLEAITISEGRPRATGARLAQEVAAFGLPVRLITEAQLELYLPDIGVVVVSARTILPDGTAVARVGTAVVARLCAAHRVPFYVVADEARWSVDGQQSARFIRVRRSANEVFAGADPGILVSNVAYDATSPSLITGYLTENGLRRGITSRSAPVPTDAEPALA